MAEQKFIYHTHRLGKIVPPRREILKDISLSLPRVLGAGGVLAELQPNLSSDESAALNKSAAVLKDAARQLGY